MATPRACLYGHDLSVVIPRSESVGFTFGMAWQGVLDFGSGPTLQIESWVMQQKCQRRVSFWGNYPLAWMTCIVFRVIKAMAHCVAYVHDRPKDNDYFRVHTTCIWYFKYLCSASSLKQRSQESLHFCYDHVPPYNSTEIGRKVWLITKLQPGRSRKRINATKGAPLSRVL